MIPLAPLCGRVSVTRSGRSVGAVCRPARSLHSAPEPERQSATAWVTHLEPLLLLRILVAVANVGSVLLRHRR